MGGVGLQHLGNRFLQKVADSNKPSPKAFTSLRNFQKPAGLPSRKDLQDVLKTFEPGFSSQQRRQLKQQMQSSIYTFSTELIESYKGFKPVKNLDLALKQMRSE